MIGKDMKSKSDRNQITKRNRKMLLTFKNKTVWQMRNIWRY